MLDGYTLLIACCALLFIFGGALGFLWLRDRRAVWLLWWGLPLALNGAASGPHPAVRPDLLLVLVEQLRATNPAYFVTPRQH